MGKQPPRLRILRNLARSIEGTITEFGYNRHGGVATIFAIALPLLLIVTVTAIEMAALHADKSRLQAVADATALNAATQMRFGANDQLLERSKTSPWANWSIWRHGRTHRR